MRLDAFQLISPIFSDERRTAKIFENNAIGLRPQKIILEIQRFENNILRNVSLAFKFYYNFARAEPFFLIFIRYISLARINFFLWRFSSAVNLLEEFKACLQVRYKQQNCIPKPFAHRNGGMDCSAAEIWAFFGVFKYSNI